MMAVGAFLFCLRCHHYHIHTFLFLLLIPETAFPGPSRGYLHTQGIASPQAKSLHFQDTPKVHFLHLYTLRSYLTLLYGVFLVRGVLSSYPHTHTHTLQCSRFHIFPYIPLRYPMNQDDTLLCHGAVVQSFHHHHLRRFPLLITKYCYSRLYRFFAFAFAICYCFCL